MIIMMNNNNNKNNINNKKLELEKQSTWQMKPKVIPVVVGALGAMKKRMVENMKKVSERATVTET